MLKDINYGGVLRQSAKFHSQPWYRCHKQHNRWYKFCVIIILPFEDAFYRTFNFFKKNYPVRLYECLGNPL